ncbi:MAG TPA: FmdB family zinc ribbon protein [Acidobacteriota bacterium]|nr:FmdB family zinc ribbon protein [Acidobacteriota bacterium]
MPIYEYQCSKCREIFEAFQKITDQPLMECRFCRGKVERLISHSSFQLKGSGWYLTDYANRSSGGSSSDTSKSTDSPEKTAVKAATETKSTTTTSESAS